MNATKIVTKVLELALQPSESTPTAVPVVPRTNSSSGELAQELTHLANAEQRERDRLREEALARERERAKYD